jgi:1,2-diacylglycerol 3-alpha-glucosyltransferase
MMNILMATNTYKPIVGGLERSVELFSEEYRKRGHRVKIIAPTFSDMPNNESDVARVPAIHNFRNTGFSIELPIPGIAKKSLKGFLPDLVHSHHPFFIGDTALRLAAEFKCPLIFTHHIMFEKNTHYAPGGESPALKKLVTSLVTGYANLCDYVFAPSRSLAELLKERGVTAPLEVVPTGLRPGELAGGDAEAMRLKYGISPAAFVVGFVSRLAPEKNVFFLARACSSFLKKDKGAHLMIAGKGQSERELRDYFEKEGLAGRTHFTGLLSRRELADAYAAMDVFAFASVTETQGLVVEEAFSAGVPVIAIDSCGVRDVVEDNVNGRLLPHEDVREFADAMYEFRRLPLEEKQKMSSAARRTTEEFDIDKCIDKALETYKKTLGKKDFRRDAPGEATRLKAGRLLKAEWELLAIMARAVESVVEDWETVKKGSH